MNRANRALFAAATLLAMTSASLAHADYFPPASERGSEGTGTMPFRLGSGAARHDAGIFVRPQIGFGYSSAEVNSGGTTQTVTGLSTAFGLSVGGVVTEGLVLHGTLTASSLPDAQVEGGDPITVEQTRNFNVTSLGFGVTYYTPENLWFSAGVAPHVMTLSTKQTGCTTDCTEDTSTEDFGLGLRAGLGYEWWVSDEWAIGLGVEGFSAQGPDVSTYGMATLFTATFN